VTEKRATVYIYDDDEAGAPRLDETERYKVINVPWPEGAVILSAEEARVALVWSDWVRRDRDGAEVALLARLKNAATNV
jgi:hypothetical protein